LANPGKTREKTEPATNPVLCAYLLSDHFANLSLSIQSERHNKKPVAMTDYIPASCGPWGQTLDSLLREQSHTNSSFSQKAWADAQMDGCLPRPARALPSWPPSPDAFTYPALDKSPQVLLDLGVAKNSPQVYGALEAPYAGGGSISKRSLNQLAQNKEYDPVFDVVNPNQCPPSMMLQHPNHKESKQDHKETKQDLAQRIVSRMNSDAAPPQPTPPAPFSPSTPWSPYDDPACTVSHADYSWKDLPKCSWNTVAGIFYDLSHWKSIPKSTAGQKLQFIFFREDRPVYLLGLVLLIVLLVFIFKLFKPKTKQQPTHVQYVVMPAGSALPPTS